MLWTCNSIDPGHSPSLKLLLLPYMQENLCMHGCVHTKLDRLILLHDLAPICKRDPVPAEVTLGTKYVCRSSPVIGGMRLFLITLISESYR